MKISVSLVIAILLSVVVVVFIIPIIINELYRVNDGYITVWNGADVLSFYGAALGALGTIVLGVVAWRQNDRLLEIEERTFFLENLSRLLITSLHISDFNRVACNFEFHTEQIVTSDRENYYDPMKCESFTLEFAVDTVENYQALLKIDRILLSAKEYGGNQTDSIIIDAENISYKYSRIAMSKEGFNFKCTCIVPAKTKKALHSVIRKSSTIVVIVDLKTVTVKQICTQWRLKAELAYLGFHGKEIYDFKVNKSGYSTCFLLDSRYVSKVSKKNIDEVDDEKMFVSIN